LVQDSHGHLLQLNGEVNTRPMEEDYFG